MKTIKNVGSFMLIERIDGDKYGEDVYYGIVKYRSKKSSCETIYPTEVTYLKKYVEGRIKIEDKFYDIVYYYNLILDVINMDTSTKKN